MRFLGWWKDLPILAKLLGTGSSGKGIHNDIFFALERSGIYGLILYLILLSAIGFTLVSKAMTVKSPISVISAMFFITWVVEAIGLVPSAYPHFQWLVFGFCALSLSDFKLETCKAIKYDKVLTKTKTSNYTISGTA